MSETELNRLGGKVAIVTGASQGIGQAIARLFAQEGAKVIVNARTEAKVISVAIAVFMNTSQKPIGIILSATIPISID